MENFFRIHLRQETFPRCIITEFECRGAIQNHEFGWIRFQNRFFKSLNNDHEKYRENSIANLLDVLEHIFSKEIFNTDSRKSAENLCD